MITSLLLAAAMLLAGAGVAKIAAPDPAAAMLGRVWRKGARPRLIRPAVRVAGAVELGVGAAAALAGDRISIALLGVCYLVFAGVAARLMTVEQGSSCGCFGRVDSPIGVPHLALNAVCVGIALAALISPPGQLGDALADDALIATVGVGQSLLLAYLGFLSITALPALTAARRQLARAR